MLTVVAFIVALGLLIAVHEYGHYRVAVACGVKVLRFSVGFGRVLWRRQATPDSTEFVVSALPLGGYVRMLDEREGPVAPAERHMAFNRKPLAQRAAIVAAGPVANLVLAMLLPFTPLGGAFGFIPLPAGFYAALAVMVLSYLGVVMAVRRQVERRAV